MQFHFSLSNLDVFYSYLSKDMPIICSMFQDHLFKLLRLIYVNREQNKLVTVMIIHTTTLHSTVNQYVLINVFNLTPYQVDSLTS
jgi:hypothetical protein